mmetsp:Transcript_26783/g.39622  ORF Transcript_26783/g.39622 Transcript_26783/m.39622 type:complete len:165 (-) Transcript_26783:152-646(-)|eukprot:CAMPEP_0194208680 /NCGR_PEP_ID=MMETSP0156-20130528/7070_1 /TAXON_ID=33649 /ORGANISM="Thalassionema nitzschioides, Strain L26-B" /LENGTH=164 /DNA_ID=CAMNT_0038935701 /DNA_START=80 /DNA_END=574 /DNA_ORIENTATION=+
MATKPRRLDFNQKADGKGESSANNRKRPLDAFLSPKKKSGKEDAFSTPSKKTQLVADKRSKKDEEYIPKYVYKNIDYKCKGQGKIDETVQQVFQLIEKHFRIPSDLEQNRKFGPKSGITFEEHAIRAYKLNMLEPRKSSDDQCIDICTHCAKEGHKRDECPELV